MGQANVWDEGCAMDIGMGAANGDKVAGKQGEAEGLMSSYAMS